MIAQKTEKLAQHLDLPKPDPFALESEDLRFLLKGKQVVEQKLGVLVRGSLYVATEKVLDAGGEQVVWPGNVLSRNQELTKRLGHDPEGALQAFQVYRTIYEFVRGVAQAEIWYDLVELPFLGEAGRTVQLLQQASWTRSMGIEAVEAHREAGADVRGLFDGKPRNEHKVAAQDKAVRGSTIEDALGRINPGRSSMLSGAARQDLAKRLNELPGIMIGLSRRHLVAARVIDDYFAELARFDDANVKNLSRRDDEWTQELRDETARRIIAYRMRTDGMILSPFRRAIGTHQRRDSDELSGAFLRGDLPTAKRLLDKGHRMAAIQYRMRDFQESMVTLSLLEKGVIALTRPALDELIEDIQKTRIPKGLDRDFTTKVVDDFNAGIDVVIDCLADKNGPHYDQAYEVGDGLHKLH